MRIRNAFAKVRSRALARPAVDDPANYWPRGWLAAHARPETASHR